VCLVVIPAGTAGRSPFATVRAVGDDGLWICELCGYVYDPAEGDADGGISPGSKFQDIPAGWSCPVCGARKEDFSPLDD
jgi:rubredoxin